MAVPCDNGNCSVQSEQKSNFTRSGILGIRRFLEKSDKVGLLLCFPSEFAENELGSRNVRLLQKIVDGLVSPNDPCF